MSMRLGLFVVALAACGESGGASPPADAAILTFKISGTATELSAMGNKPVAGMTVEAFARDDEATVVAAATTDANGVYSITIVTERASLDGYLKATKSGLIDTYLYPSAPLTSDFGNASLNVVTMQTFEFLSSTLCGEQQDAAKGTVAAVVQDDTGNPVAGAVIKTTPATPDDCYNVNGFPNRNGVMTDTDGVGFLFNLNGDVSITATKAGATFKTHGIKVRPGVVTQTIIAP